MIDLEATSGVPVLDGYGTTESGGVARATVRHRRPGSVGKSIGTEIAIHNETGIAPPGKAGEILIRGANVTAGYLDDEEANRRAFSNGWFRTGDMGYLDEDGYLFITGRLKEMINRGGQKILPQQVEAVLKAFPGVEEAAVFGVEHRTLGEEVAAAVVVREEPPTEEALRAYAACHLAPYKVPHRILFVDALPRNAMGKPLRKSLAQMVHQRDLEEREKTSVLLTQTEKLLAAMWEETFRCGPVGRNADFATMGGDSLMLAFLAARIQDAFGVELDAGIFANHARLRDLAAAIDKQTARTSPAAAAPERAPRLVPAPLSFAQERTWKYTWPSTRPADGTCSLNYNMAFLHSVRGRLNTDLLQRSLNFVVRQHEILHTAFEERFGVPVQLPRAARDIDFPVLDFSNAPDARCRALDLLNEDARTPFHLRHGPLLRLKLVRIASDEHLLLRVNHHIISDAASWELFLREWGAAYGDLASGRELKPDTPRYDYRGYAWWQSKEFDLAKPMVQDGIEWWSKQLCRDRPPAGPFHKSVNEPAQGRSASRSGNPADGILWFGLDPGLSARIEELCRAEGSTYFITRFAACAALHAHLNNHPEVVLGCYFSHRKRTEWRNIMGDFTNLVTLVLDCDLNLSFREWLRVVRHRVAECRTRSEIPYELVRKELRLRGQQPRQIEVMFHAADHTAPQWFGTAEMTWVSRSIPAMPWGFTLTVDKHNEDRLCNVTFDAGLYAPESVKAYVARYVLLLKAASSHPDWTLKQLISVSKIATAAASSASG